MALSMRDVMDRVHVQSDKRHTFEGMDTYAWEGVAQHWREAIPHFGDRASALADEANMIALTLQLMDTKVGL